METQIKMSRVSILESNYMLIKKEMRENNERNFIDYLKRKESDFNTIQERLRDCTVKLLNLNEDKKTLEEQLNHQKEHSKFLSEELSKTNTELSKWKKEYAVFERNTEIAIKYDHDIIADLKEQLSKEHILKDNLTTECNQKNAEINSLSERVTSFRKLLSEKDNQLSDLSREFQEVLEKMVRMTESNQLLEQKLESLRTFKGRIKNLFSK